MLWSFDKVRKYQCFFPILKDSAKHHKLYLSLDPPFECNLNVHMHMDNMAPISYSWLKHIGLLMYMNYFNMVLYFAYPDSWFGEVCPHGNLFASAHVRIAIASKSSLQLLQLLRGEVSPLTSLTFACLPAILVRLFGSRGHCCLFIRIGHQMWGLLLLLLLMMVVLVLEGRWSAALIHLCWNNPSCLHRRWKKDERGNACQLAIKTRNC